MADDQKSNPVTSETAPKVPQLEMRRDPKTFIAGYANNVMVESNTFDLRLVFGVLDQRNPLKAAVDQFAGINLSWPEVKLLIFWMQIHVAGFEKENGKIKIPTTALPPDVGSSILPTQLDNEKGRESIELIRKMRADFIASQTDS
jgi:hypothetical protein